MAVRCDVPLDKLALRVNGGSGARRSAADRSANVQGRHTLSPVFRRRAFQVAGVLVLAALVGNVHALVDSALHPEIPYFAREHLIVGGVTALVSVALSSLLLRYVQQLAGAMDTMNRFEAILPICSSCRMIRRSGADPSAMESWQPLESYISEKTMTEFSHGICPGCMAALYPEYLCETQRKRGCARL